MVEPRILFRSGQISPMLVERVLLRHGIKVIVDLELARPECPKQRAEATAARKLGILHRKFPLAGDGTGDYRCYADALDLIHRSLLKRVPTLIHCSAGSQRTGAAVAFYRLLFQRRDPDAVVQEMMRYDWDPEGNGVLLDYVNEHIDDVAGHLVEHGALAAVPDPLPVLTAQRSSE